MEISLFLAKVIGLYFVIVSLFVLIRYKIMAQMILEITSQPSVMFVFAILTLILGILLVVSHNIWVGDWRLIITIIAWLSFISGIVRLFLIHSAKSVGEWWLKHCGFLMSIMVVYLIVGLYLLYVSITIH